MFNRLLDLVQVFGGGVSLVAASRFQSQLGFEFSAEFLSASSQIRLTLATAILEAQNHLSYWSEIWGPLSNAVKLK
jgi:hypothetical protein